MTSRRQVGHILSCLFLWFFFFNLCCLVQVYGEKSVEKKAPEKKIVHASEKKGVQRGAIAVYRLVGNDMPPLQSQGQLRMNTQYALKHEQIAFKSGTKRWILNRIWNETEFSLIYGSLIEAGVQPKDIVLRCFDIDTYMQRNGTEDKLLYLTSQNEGRNAGILDGRASGFEWSLILDGNTFITEESWMIIRRALKQASLDKKLYMKIPYHRMAREQRPSFVNASARLEHIMEFAPMQGESQVAFHYAAPEMFSLGETYPIEGWHKSGPTKGYGARNKAYLFKDGQVCDYTSKQCACADFKEGNEEDNVRLIKEGNYHYII